MIKKALLALAIAGAVTTAQATVVINEGFESVSTLTSSGWSVVNASTPTGEATLGWFQSTVGFDAQSGSEKSYAAATYNSAAIGGILNDWLVTPVFSTLNGATVSFWLSGEAYPGATDNISYGFIDATGAFTALVLETAVTVTTGVWTQYTATIGANVAATSRFAINYFGNADTSNFVGVDSLIVDAADAAAVPEPTSIAILAAGLMGLAAARRRKNKQA